jgi:hypothetical protein
LGFGGGRRSLSFAHAFHHWNYFLRHFYFIESTAVIPVNLKISYESTVLSRAERRKHPTAPRSLYIRRGVFLQPYPHLSLVHISFDILNSCNLQRRSFLSYQIHPIHTILPDHFYFTRYSVVKVHFCQLRDYD